MRFLSRALFFSFFIIAASHTGLPDVAWAQKSPATVTPPSDQISMEWVRFIEAHPPCTSKGHAALYQGCTTPAQAKERTKTLRQEIMYGVEVEFDMVAYGPPADDRLVRELLTYSVTAEDYALYAHFQQLRYQMVEATAYMMLLGSDEDLSEDTLDAKRNALAAALKKEGVAWVRDGLRAVDLALALKHPNPGKMLARRAAIQVLLKQPEAALKSLEEAVAAGFGGFIWMRQSPDLGVLRQRPEWSAWYAKMLPEKMLSAPLEKNFEGVLSSRHDSSARFTFCSDGRYLREEFERASSMLTEGRWTQSDKGLTLTPERYCDNNDGEPSLPCPTLSTEARAEHPPSVLIPRQDLVIIQQTTGNYHDSSLTFDHKKSPYCQKK